jgi:acyl-CoA dehydrogenase
MDFGLTPAQVAVETKARKFAAVEIAPIVEQLENDINLRQEIFQKMAKVGFLLMCVPKDQGGDYTDYLSYVLALKAIASVDAGMAVGMSIMNMLSEILVTYGTSEQKEKYLTRMRKGEGLPLAFALTEKEAGSDSKSITTEAKLDNNDYILNGTKQFITNADIAGLILVLAKTNNREGAHGITAFLVDQGTEGFVILKKERKMGLLSANLVDFALENCKVPKNQILGKIGQGFEIAMRALDAGRIGISAQALGIAEAAYEAALKHSKERYQFGHPLAENQVIAFKLADMFVKINAAKGLLYKTCWHKDRGENINLFASVAKVFCTESSIEVVDEALQIFGGYGYVKDNPLERYYRDVRVTTLYEGTSEIQRLIISRAILSE